MFEYAKYFVRTLFLCFWAIVIYGCLQLPYVWSFFEQEKSLSIYIWADKIEESLLQDFEKETGIKVYVNYYESNEELLTKLETMPYIDCDIVFPSGYIIDRMIDGNLLKKIDHKKCPFVSGIYPEFMHTIFDIKNEYSLPLYWDVLGVGVSKEYARNNVISWDVVFEKDQFQGQQIGMIDDSRETLFMAAVYLGYDLDKLSDKQLKEVRHLLGAQKKWVGMYNDTQLGYFLSSKTFPLVVSLRESICRTMLQDDTIAFVIPGPKSLLAIENVAISSSTKKDEWVYQLINYIYRKDVLLKNCQSFCILPVVKDVFLLLDKKYIGVEGLCPGESEFEKLVTFKNVLTQKQLNDFWVRFKAS